MEYRRRSLLLTFCTDLANHSMCSHFCLKHRIDLVNNSLRRSRQVFCKRIGQSLRKKRKLPVTTNGSPTKTNQCSQRLKRNDTSKVVERLTARVLVRGAGPTVIGTSSALSDPRHSVETKIRCATGASRTCKSKKSLSNRSFRMIKSTSQVKMDSCIKFLALMGYSVQSVRQSCKESTKQPAVTQCLCSIQCIQVKDPTLYLSTMTRTCNNKIL